MTSPAYEQKLGRLGRLVNVLGLPRAGELTLLASEPTYAVAPAGDGDECEFLQLMRETLHEVASDRRRFTPHG